jgi:hypothetical protein
MPNTFTDVPIASHTLAQDQDPMRQNFNYLVDTLGTSNAKNGDHQISLAGVDSTQFEGRHRQVCFNNRHGAAPTAAGIGDGTNALLYADDGNIFLDSTTLAGPYKITNVNAAMPLATFGATNNGWTFLPGGLFVQYGRVNGPNVPSTGTVTFAQAFPTALFSVFFNFARNASSTDSFWIDDTKTFDKTTFSWKSSTGSASKLYWVAIGK